MQIIKEIFPLFFLWLSSFLFLDNLVASIGEDSEELVQK